MSTTLRSRTLKATSIWYRDTAPETKTKKRRLKEESRLDGQHSPSIMTARDTAYNVKGNTGTFLKRQVYNSCVLPVMTYAVETWALITQTKNKLAAAQTTMERSMLNVTYRDRKTNIWIREKTNVTDVIEQVRRQKWT